MSNLTREQAEALQAAETEKELKRFNDVKSKLIAAVDAIKEIAIKQEWDVNTFSVVFNLMNDAVKRKVYNTKFVTVLEDLTDEDPIVQGLSVQEADRIKKEEIIANSDSIV